MTYCVHKAINIQSIQWRDYLSPDKNLHIASVLSPMIARLNRDSCHYRKSPVDYHRSTHPKVLAGNLR